MRKGITTIFTILTALVVSGVAAQDAPVKVKTKAKQTAHAAQHVDAQVRHVEERARRAEERERRREEKIERKAEKWEDYEQVKQKGTEIRLKLERGIRVVINNFSGEVTVTGIDGDTLEARATDDEGELAPLDHRTSGTTVFIGGEGRTFRRGGSAEIQVKVPRYVSQLDVDVLSGDITVSNLDGGVKTNATSGNVVIQCVKGNVVAKSASGTVELRDLTGNVTGETLSGSVEYYGVIRQGGSYRLHSMSGEVEMQVQADAPGFTATLTTFSGEIETAFPLKIEKSSQYGGTNRQIVGRYGEGGATLSLNSFSGSVRIVKATARTKTSCT